LFQFAAPYCTPRTGRRSWGLTLRTIQPRLPKSGDHPWLAAYRKALGREDLAPVTLRGYHSDLGAFLHWYAPQPLERLAALDLAHFRQHLSRDRHLQPSSINRKLEAVRRFCRWAHASGKLASNIAADVKLLRVARGHQPKGLTSPEVLAILRTAGQSHHGLARRNYALVQIMLQAGLRVSEVARLSIRDLEIRDRVGRVKIQGKGAKERIVPLNTTARRALNVYLQTRSEIHEQQHAVFLSETGTPLSVRSIQTVIANLARRARLKRIPVSAHTLRHTFALNFLQQNPGKLIELATLLGHESLDTTAVYTQPSEEELAEQVEKSLLNVDR